MNYTQAELVTRIQTVHESFSSLDEITLSRWENGHTKPSNRKQIALLIFFDFLDDFNKLYSDDKNQSGRLDKVLSKRYKDNFSDSDNPYGVSSPEVIVNFYEGVPKERLEFYCDYIEKFNDVEVTPTELSRMHSEVDKVGLYEFKSQTGAMLGHFLYIIVDNDFIKGTLSSKNKQDI
ncbi:hypothetical protein AB4298_19235 [Shewanella sp. 10N.261.52.F9]|uniref:hypothetical protein n=1 Tax=Shewanella sp. 10N.261.52.F9 TaxID=3229684 RepID=UPI00354AFA95